MDNNLQLLEHNVKTYAQVKDFIEHNQDCCVVNPCGSGKSSIIANIIEDYTDKNIIVITKQKNAGTYYRNRCKAFNERHVPVYTYNALYNIFKNNKMSDLSETDIAIYDESHYVGADKWFDAFMALRDVSGCLSIGVTATPQRFKDQGTNRTIVDLFGGNSAGNYTLNQLQRKGVFIEPEYVVSLASMEEEITKRIEKINESDLDENLKEKYYKRLQAAHDNWMKNDCPAKVIPKLLPNYMYKQTGNKILVFCKDSNAMKRDEAFLMPIIRQAFPDKRIKSYQYSYKSNESCLHEFMTNNSNYINVMFSINKICETVHINDLNIVIFMRSAISNRVITQQIGRINDINNPNKSLIIDMVDNLSRYDSVHFIAENGKTLFENNDSGKKEHISININYLRQSINIFGEIDRATSNSVTYSYNDIYGSLKQLCYIFRRKHTKVLEYMNKGYELEDAMEFPDTHIKYKDTKSRLPDIEKPISEEAMKLTEQFYPAIERIMSLKNCHDEDIHSKLTLDLCSICQRYIDSNSNTNASSAIQTKLLRQLLIYLRQENDIKIHTTELDESMEIPDCSIEPYNIIEHKQLKEKLNYVLKTLTKREQEVLDLRFGLTTSEPMSLDNVGLILGVTRERVRQIEAKALRRLRHPNHSKYLKDFIEE